MEQPDIDEGEGPEGAPSEELAELRRLRREVRILKMAIEALSLVLPFMKSADE